MLFKRQNITCSMSRRGEFWYSAEIKNSSLTLKTSGCARRFYRTREQAKANVLDYIEQFYNAFRSGLS